MDLGLKLTKVHRVLKFVQSPWLKDYIDFNTQKRTQAKIDLKKTSRLQIDEQFSIWKDDGKKS